MHTQPPSATQLAIERLFEALTNGDRVQARLVVDSVRKTGISANDLLLQVYWPTHQMFEKLYRQDQMTKVSYHLGTRLLRSLVDQASGTLTLSQRTGQTVFAACGPSEGEELAGQMACDLLEASGLEISFAGGGIPADEILNQVQERRPDFLVLFASAASDLPGIRSIIDQLREINAVPHTKICVGGGVFARAEGLAEEMGCELCARDPMELVELLTMPEVTQGDMGTLTITSKQAKPAKAKAASTQRLRNAA